MMMNHDKILNSYNLKIQDKIFEQQDIIDESRQVYRDQTSKTKQEYETLIKEARVPILESQVYMKYLKEEIKIELKRKEDAMKKKLLNLKEDYKLEQMQIKDEAKLYLLKINSIYAQEKKKNLDLISKQALNLEVDESDVLDLDLYQKELNKLTKTFEKKRLEKTKSYYFKELRKNHKFKIRNSNNKEQAKIDYQAFIDDYKTNIKNNPNADLEMMQQQLIFSSDYKYYLIHLEEVYEKQKQKLINKSYKEHQALIQKEILNISDDRTREKELKRHYEGDVLMQRRLRHERQAQEVSTKISAFEIEYKEFYQLESEKTNSVRDAELEKAKLKYEADVKVAKDEYELFKQVWEEKYYNKAEVKRLKEQLQSASSTEEKKALKEEIKLQNFVYKEKKHHKELIKLQKVKIKEIKLELKEKLKEEKQTYYEFKFQRDQSIVRAKARIKDLKLERKQHYKNLSTNDKNEYRKVEKFARQERISRVRIKLDKQEQKALRKFNPAYFYVLPAFLAVGLFTVFPFFFMVIGSFFKIDLTTLSNSQFVGFTNYYNAFARDKEFQMALSNTLIYSLFTVVLLSVVTIGMSAWLARDTKVHNVAQTMIFTPHIASFVAISILWMAMLNPEKGLINQFLALLGVQGPGWLVDPKTALLSVSFVTVWKDIGYYVLIIISGLQSIPSYVYEAAKLDKASKSTQFFKLTLPLLTPTLSFVFLTKFINSFKVFAPIQIMTNGGPMGSSMVLSFWIYKMGRVGYNYGIAMTGAVVLTIVIASFTLINNRFSRRTVRYY